MLVWEDKVFYTIPSEPPGNRKVERKVIIETDISKEIRKPLSQLTLKGLRLRFIPLLNLIDVIAEKEEVDSKIIAAYALKLISNESVILTLLMSVIKSSLQENLVMSPKLCLLISLLSC